LAVLASSRKSGDKPAMPWFGRRRLLPWFTCLLLLGAAAASIARLFPPAHDDPTDGFSTEKAMAHLRVIAREPRPLGSPANLAARDYLVEQFTKLGYETRVGSGTGPIGRQRLPLQAHNVLARLRGTARDGRAIVLAAHYDSVRSGPGAGDDGAAVAALLEVARVLAADPRPRRDVIFLITDGEEIGLLGARVFTARDPWRSDADLVLNFEARGTSGPSILFETSGGNGWLIEQYARVSPHPVTSSLAFDVYKLLRNDTDFTIFRRAGLGGLNFALIGSYANYHTPDDDVAHLSERSLRHHGRQALALARHLANVDALDVRSGDDAIYFDVLSLAVVRYPAKWALPLAGGAAALLAVVLGWGFRRGRIRAPGVITAVGWCLISVTITCGVSYGLLQVLPRGPVARHPGVAAAGLACVGLAVVLGFLFVTRHRRRTATLASGGLIVWAAMALASAVWLPGGSYLFLAPTVLGTLTLALYFGRRVTLDWLAVLVAVPCVVIVTPLAYLAFLALTLRSGYVVVALPTLLLWTLVPQLRLALPVGAPPPRVPGME
jgi:hypothetical protein